MILARGDSGGEVEYLQGKLKRLGFYTRVIDGRYGRFTYDAVMDFQERYFCDGIANASTLKAVEEAVEAWDRRERTTLLTVPHGLKEVEAQFGAFTSTDTRSGYVRITDDWVERNIVRVSLPVVGEQTVHARIAPVFAAVLTEIQKRGLDSEIEMFFCWCPRHQRHNPRLPLSLHTWAIAVDINPATNQPGTRGDMHPGIVEVFERFGFQWGGRWKNYLDPQHFQYADGC